MATHKNFNSKMSRPKALAIRIAMIDFSKILLNNIWKMVRNISTYMMARASMTIPDHEQVCEVVNTLINVCFYNIAVLVLIVGASGLDTCFG